MSSPFMGARMAGPPGVPLIGSSRAVSIGFVMALKGVLPDAPMHELGAFWMNNLHVAIPFRRNFTVRSSVELAGDDMPPGVAPPDPNGTGRRVMLITLIAELRSVDPAIPVDALVPTVLSWLSIGLGVDQALERVTAKEIPWSEYEALLQRIEARTNEGGAAPE